MRFSSFMKICLVVFTVFLWGAIIYNCGGLLCH